MASLVDSLSAFVPSKKPLRWAVIWAYLKYWTWQVVTKTSWLVIYIAVISEGLRYSVPPLAQKLYKIPGLSDLQDYELTHAMDMAQLLALFMAIAVCFLWEEILELRLQSEDTFDDHGWNSETHRQLIVGLGVVILGADACLFYVAMTQMGWQGTTLSIPALLATCAYIAVLVWVSFVTISLRQTISDLKKET